MCVSGFFLINNFLAATSECVLSDYTINYIPILKQTYKWPNSAVKWFPTELQSVVEIDTGPDVTKMLQELENASEQTDQVLQCLMPENENFIRQNGTILISIFRYIFQNSNFPITTYKILSSLNARDLIIATNNFVDYIILKSRTLVDSHYERVSLYF